jgi:cell division protein FtsA
MRPLPAKRSALVAALDIGTSKIACLIGRLKPQAPTEALRRRSHSVEIIGIGHTRARGIKSGSVVDLGEAEESVRQAVAAAERMAGVEADAVIVSVSAGRITSELYAATVHVAGTTVNTADIERVLAAGTRHSVRDGRVVLHSLPIGYALDDQRGAHDPRGMLAKRLGVDMHVVTADVASLRNLMLTVEHCHLGVKAMVASPYMSGLAVLADDEADLGAALIDIGAGTTTIAVFSGGHFVHADGFAVGGHHITMDLARGLTASMADAERLKTLYGSVLASTTDADEVISVPAIAGDEHEPPHMVTRASLLSIVKPRMEEILEMARDRLAASPFAAEPRGRIVLTGGASQLTGATELAGRILGRQVRIGRPLGIAGLPDAAKGPAFAAAAGLLVYPQVSYLEHFERRHSRRFMSGTGGYFARVGRWLRESF